MDKDNPFLRFFSLSRGIRNKETSTKSDWKKRVSLPFLYRNLKHRKGRSSGISLGASNSPRKACQHEEPPKVRHVPHYLANYFRKLVPDEPENSSGPEGISLLDLPMEILEPIVLSMDAHTAIHLEQCSNRARRIVREILGGTKGLQFWKDECFKSLPKSLSHTIMASYFNVIAEPLRIEIPGEDDKIWNAMTLFSYEEVFRRVVNLLPTLQYSGLKLEHLAKRDDEIKTEVLWNFNRKNRANLWSSRFTSTVGPTLFNVIVPSAWPAWEPHVMYIFENMNEIRRQTITPFRAEKMYSYRIMNYPVKKPKTDLSLDVNVRESPPKALKIFVGVFEKYIYLTQFNQGNSCRISTASNLVFMYNIDMPPLIAILDDFLGVWTKPESYKLFRVNVDPKFGHVSTTLLMHIEHWRMPRLWKIFGTALPYYLTCFSVSNHVIDRNNGFPAFTIMSPKCGTYILESADPDGGVHFLKSLIYAKSKSIPAFENPIGSVQGHGTIFFWTAKLLAVGFLVHKWYYETWEEIDILETVTMAEVIAPRLVMLNTKNEIIIIKLVYSTPPEPHQNFKAGGRKNNYLLVEIIRRIGTDILTKHGFINHFHFDFDRARPYIFIVLEAYKPRDGGEHCNFYFKKLWFSNRGKDRRLREQEQEEADRDFPELWRSYFMDPKNKRIATLLNIFQANIP